MKMNKHYNILVLLCLLAFGWSCNDETYDESMAVGLWKQVSVTEDGAAMALTPEQQSCKLLIESNGICRFYHKSFEEYGNGTGPTSFYGTWSMLDDEWMNITTDKWQFVPQLSTDSAKVILSYKTVNDVSVIDTLTSVKKQWNKYHIQSRFTILKLTDTEMEIRLKTFVGEKKYAMLFAPDPVDFIETTIAGSGVVNFSPKLITDSNYWIIRNEFQTLKTYVFTFKREDF
jgi:hypothetical protein